MTRRFEGGGRRTRPLSRPGARKPVNARSTAGSPSRRRSGRSRCSETTVRSSNSARSRSGRAALLASAETLGAEIGEGLAHVEVVAAAEGCEQIAGIVGDDRQLVRFRAPAAQDGRDREARLVGRGGCVPVPGGVVRQSGEVREAAGVDAPVRARQRRAVELVEHDHDDRRRVPGAGGRLRALIAREQQVGDRRHEEEEQNGQERNGREHRQRARQEAGAPVCVGAGRAGEDRGADGQDPRRAAPIATICRTIAAMSTPTKARCSARRARAKGNSSASQATSTVGATSVAASASATMSKFVLSRATKNSGLSCSTSNSGQAKAKHHSAARCSQGRRAHALVPHADPERSGPSVAGRWRPLAEQVAGPGDHPGGGALTLPTGKPPRGGWPAAPRRPPSVVSPDCENYN